MSGARARALAVRQLLANDSKTADVYVGLEGGLRLGSSILRLVHPVDELRSRFDSCIRALLQSRAVPSLILNLD